MIALADFMDPTLHPVKRRITPVLSDQLVVRAVLDHAAPLDRDYPVGAAHRRQAVRDDEDGPPLAICRMFCWMMRSLS